MDLFQIQSTMSPAAADCTFSHCLCRWINYCSPRIPRIASDGEYLSTPADAADSPAWSLLAGILSVSDGGDRSLRIHRFRVAYSGRVLGRSGDSLETFGDDCYEAKNASSRIRASTATRGPDGRSLSLCLFAWEFDLLDLNRNEPARPLELRLELGDTAEGRGIALSHLPRLPEGVKPNMPICPISAAGGLWAPYLTERYGPCVLVMQHFDKDSDRWVEVASIDSKRPRTLARMQEDAIRPLQGFVVIGNTILLSLSPYHLFFTFDCSTGTWAEVVTSKTQRTHYVPIRERGVYVEEDDTIYFLYCGIVYAYKLFKDQNGHQVLSPPINIDCIDPFYKEECAYLAHLGTRIMCAVWISVNLRCNCDAKHVRITTFRVKGGFHQQQFVPKSIEVLHSTRRLLDVSPSKPSKSHLEFAFLQEYEELNHEDATPPAKRKRGDTTEPSMLVEATKIPSNTYVVEFSKMLACCREFFDEPQFLNVAMCEGSAIKTNNTLYMICQVATRSTVYKMNILNGRLTCHDETLTPHCILDISCCNGEDDMMDQPPPWHFFDSIEGLIYAAPSSEDDNVYVCQMFTGFTSQINFPRPAGSVFHLVFRIGSKVFALSDNLHGVYRLDPDTRHWIFCETLVPACVERKVYFSGYVALDSETFIVSDAESNCCFMLKFYDHDSEFHDYCGEWKLVMSYDEYETSSQVETPLTPSLMHGNAFLNGRSFFVKGFIYTCSDGGLAAYELIEHCGSHYLGDQIDLQFSWLKCWEVERMCLVHVAEDTSSGAIMFCVLQDDYISGPGYDNKKPVLITTVEVKTERLHNGKLKPKKIDHVDIAMSSVELDGKVHIRNCWAC
ncbi:hypothetical protein EJB05_45469, partial [Eragrostis curvula]